MKKETGNCSPGTNAAYLLSAVEKDDPVKVFRELFDAYKLYDLRQRLRQIVESSLSDRDCDAQSYFFLFRHLEKLVEAAYVLAESDRIYDEVQRLRNDTTPPGK